MSPLALGSGVIVDTGGYPTNMRRILALAAVQCLVLGSLTAPAVVGLSLMITRMVGHAAAPATLSLVVASGSVAAMIANPLLGWCVDRTPRRLGGRRIWLVAGAVMGLAGSCLVAFARDPFMLAAAWVMTQAAYNACFAAINGMVSHGLAERDRVRMGAVFTATASVGLLPGLAVAALFPTDAVMMTILVPVAAALVIPFLAWRLADPHEPSDPRRARSAERRAARRGTITVPFLAVSVIRFVFAGELAAGLVFGLFLFMERWQIPEAEAVRLVSSSTLIGASGLLAASGILALLRRRAPGERLLLGGAILVLVAAMVGRGLAATPEQFQLATFFAGAAIGVGFATTRSVVQSQIPPTHAALGLGLFNIANTLASIAAPIAATALLSIGRELGFMDGYAAMYLLLAVPVLACAVLLPIVARRPLQDLELAGPAEGV